MMKQFFRTLCVATLVGLLFIGIGCRKNRLEPTSNDAGFGFFPLEMGNTWIYQVDSIHYNPFGQVKIDTFSFFYKYVVSDTTLDNNGIRNSIVSIYKSDLETGPYTFNRDFVRRIVDYRAETTDSGLRMVSLVFPPSIFKFWDTNAFNKKQEEEAEIVQVESSETIGDIQYDNVIHVLQRDEDFKTLKNYGIEKYAKGKGLVFLQQIRWTKKTINDPEEVPKGYDYTYTLKSFEE